jgi:hypothetical protein
MTCVEFAAEAGLTSQVRSAVDSVSSLLTRTPTDDEIRVGSAMMRQLLDVRLLLRVAAAADHDDPGTAEDLDHILALGGVDLALLLLDEIVDVEPGPLRTYLIERAVTVLGDDPRPLLENLRRLEPSRLGIRLEALALTPSMAARDQLIAILDHADPNIRRIVVELIPDDALRHLWKRMALMLVGDRDPQVRCAILERMERGRFPAITQVLTQMVTAESFHDRAPQEKRLALEILVRTAGESSVQVMAGLLNLKVGMMARRTAETRTLAALALGWIGSSAARTELTRAARSWDPGLRKAGKDGLQVIERRRS